MYNLCKVNCPHSELVEDSTLTPALFEPTHNNNTIHGIIPEDIQCNLESVGVHHIIEDSVCYVSDSIGSLVELLPTTVHSMFDVHYTV